MGESLAVDNADDGPILYNHRPTAHTGRSKEQRLERSIGLDDIVWTDPRHQ